MQAIPTKWDGIQFRSRGCRVCGGGHKIYRGGSVDARRRILNHWKTAGNSVQWMGRR